MANITGDMTFDMTGGMTGDMIPSTAGAVVVDPTMSFISGYNQATYGSDPSVRDRRSGFHLDSPTGTTSGSLIKYAFGSSVTVGNNLQVRGAFGEESKENEEGENTFYYNFYLIGYGFGADQSAQKADANANWGQSVYTTASILNSANNFTATFTATGTQPVQIYLSSSALANWQSDTGLGATARPYYVRYSGVTSSNWIVMGIGQSNTITLS